MILFVRPECYMLQVVGEKGVCLAGKCSGHLVIQVASSMWCVAYSG